MSYPRRKPDEEISVRKTAGSRLARERMMQTAGPVYASGNVEVLAPPTTNRQDVASRLVLPRHHSGVTSSADHAPDALLETKPETDLRFSIVSEVANKRRVTSFPLIFSVLAHASLLAIALFSFSNVTEFPPGGEAAIAVDMVFVAPDIADAPATESGASLQAKIPEATVPVAVEISVPLPNPITDAVVISLPEVLLALPNPAPPVQIEIPPARIEIPEPPAPIVQQTEPLSPVLVQPDGTLPPPLEPVTMPIPPKPRPVVDQDRIRRDELAVREARRQQQLQEAQEERREAQKQAQLTERRKQQAQRTALEAQRRAAAEAARSQPVVARATTPARGETGAGAAQATRQARQAGGGTQGAAATAGTAEIASYRSRILAHLARFKTYPESAQDAGIQGRATVSFTITRAGGVTSASLAGSSGAGVLDQATLAMVRRAQPFPAMPAGGPASMSFTAVIRYDLR